uniref:Uncharacterized protein n=1 Tax=Cacopsylla melanoneura TaxID=428564 RepID=A0A8D8X2Z4_9HEMI
MLPYLKVSRKQSGIVHTHIPSRSVNNNRSTIHKTPPPRSISKSLVTLNDKWILISFDNITVDNIFPSESWSPLFSSSLNETRILISFDNFTVANIFPFESWSFLSQSIFLAIVLHSFF